MLPSCGGGRHCSLARAPARLPTSLGGVAELQGWVKRGEQVSLPAYRFHWEKLTCNAFPVPSPLRLLRFVMHGQKLALWFSGPFSRLDVSLVAFFTSLCVVTAAGGR